MAIRKMFVNFLPILEDGWFQDDHEFGQIIVRMHSKQVMAIFDRFGRLLKGDPDRPQTVLEYIVMERHMRPVEWSSHWRVHAKIHSNTPDDVTSHNVKMSLRTQVVPDSFGECGRRTLYSSDIIKSNIRQNSKSIISKTAMIFEK